MSRLTVALLVAVSAIAQKLPRPVPIPSDLARDAYELYSAIYRNSARCDKVNPDELIVISRDSATMPHPNMMKQALSPRSAEEREMVKNLETLSQKNYSWEARFDLGRAYRILTDDEEAIVSDCKFQGFAGHPNEPKCQPYANVRVIREFSLPSFNRDHTRALVFTVRACGSLCGGLDFTEYRKTGSIWKFQEQSFAHGCVLF